jgi:hypothetical protein
VQQSLAEPFLASIIQRENLYPAERAVMSMSGVVDLMRKNIEVRPLQKSGGKTGAAFVLEILVSRSASSAARGQGTGFRADGGEPADGDPQRFWCRAISRL